MVTACSVAKCRPTTVTVDGLGVSVDVAGPEKGSVVVVLGAAHHAPAAYDARVSAAAHRVAADRRHRARTRG